MHTASACALAGYTLVRPWLKPGHTLVTALCVAGALSYRVCACEAHLFGRHTHRPLEANGHLTPTTQFTETHTLIYTHSHSSCAHTRPHVYTQLRRLILKRQLTAAQTHIQHTMHLTHVGAPGHQSAPASQPQLSPPNARAARSTPAIDQPPQVSLPAFQNSRAPQCPQCVGPQRSQAPAGLPARDYTTFLAGVLQRAKQLAATLVQCCYHLSPCLQYTQPAPRAALSPFNRLPP